MDGELLIDFRTLESQREFFEQYPDWAPVLDDEGRVVGVQSPFFPTDKFLITIK